VEGSFCEVRPFVTLGALRLPLARKSGVDHMIYIVIVEPLSLALNALSPETQPLGYGAAPLILGRTRDANSVQFQLHKGVIDQCPARSGHEPLALELLPKPVTQRSGAVLPVDGLVANNPCQATFVPDAGHEALVVCKLLESAPYEVLAVFDSAVCIYPWEPRPQVLPVALS
jgi:hypothetical protein